LDPDTAKKATPPRKGITRNRPTGWGIRVYNFMTDLMSLTFPVGEELAPVALHAFDDIIGNAVGFSPFAGKPLPAQPIIGKENRKRVPRLPKVRPGQRERKPIAKNDCEG
jgi:hypothetical protein